MSTTRPLTPRPRTPRSNTSGAISRLTAATSLAVALAVGAVSGCATAPASRPAKPVVLTASQVAALRAYGRGDSAFGLEVLSALCRERPGSNEVISPVSLATGLGMTYLGARGSTAAAMARVLHLPAAGQDLTAGLHARWALLRSLDRPGVVFAASNRIWADPSLPTRPSFAAALRAGYQAGLTRVPLLSQPDQARRTINAAVAAQTRGHIDDLLPPGSLGQVGWVLTDALYLDARWAQPFNRAMSGPGSFATTSGQVTAHYMNGGSFPVAKADGWTAAALPYRGGRLRMLALLPPTAAPTSTAGHGCPLPGLATLGALTAGLSARASHMAISLPRVKLATSASLRPVLSALGMGIAFSQQADFSGLSPKACCIGFVRHAATLDVAEKGTVASAATAVGIAPSAEEIRLAFDRPYLLVLTDSLTGEPLMLAWVADPAVS